MFVALKRIFSNNYLHLTLNVSQDLETTIVERPARWMDKDDVSSLREDLITVASKTLDRGSLTYGVFKEDGSGLDKAIITLIRERKSGKPVAFNALAVMDVNHGSETLDVIHLGLVMVDPDVRSRGLSWVLYGLTCVLLFLRKQMRPTWISNVTQVPAIVGMVAETFSGVYPHPQNNNRRTIKHLLLAREIMRDHRHVFGVGEDANFDEQRFVITNAYTGGSDDLKKSFEVAQKHRDEVYNDFCEEQLDYERGDDVIQLGRIDMKAAKDYLFKSVPRSSLLGILAAGVFVVIQRIALPVFYWLDTSRPWGELRARKS